MLAGSAFVALAVAAAQAQGGTLINNNSLLISTTTYQDIGAVAGLAIGSSIPGGSAVSNGALNTVWSNESVDASFGVTSAITLQDLSVSSASVLASETLNPSKVVTSFSSKSELGLNITNTDNGKVATLMGYASGGAGYPATAVGLLDVSNSDTTAYSDSTNPVTTFYGANYAFNRSVVAVGADGSYSITQTLAYGGNNGREAVLAPNGLDYTVGNGNNGKAKPVPSQLSTSTGLEVVTPGAAANSTMIDPTYTSVAGDKAGKDSNFRGLTYYNGSLYFTKGSGGNGVDTVYTVSNPGGSLPTAATASSATVTILPGFPTGASANGADYTPFGLFFANADTLYVADEGTGDATDVAANAGLEKWSLVNGIWSLDYTLRDGLIGSTYDVAGWNYEETTIGLRDLTGRINADGTVTFWATTSTSSASGDNGADPNEIVTITDSLGALTLPGESFSVFDGPQAGLRYGGVAFAAAPEASTWAMMTLGFAALGIAAVRGRRAKAQPRSA